MEAIYSDVTISMSEFKKNPALDIHLLNVQPPFSRYVSRFLDQTARNDVHREQSKLALEPVRRALDQSGIPYTVHTDVVGDKAGCIVETARKLRCHRIVMSTARKSSLHRLLGQSVTNSVIERTTVPVEMIAGAAVPILEKIGLPAGVSAGALLVWMTAAD